MGLFYRLVLRTKHVNQKPARLGQWNGEAWLLATDFHAQPAVDSDGHNRLFGRGADLRR
jgi:hypothetical protein